MLTPDEIFHVCSDGVKPLMEGDKKQGYNHKFVCTCGGCNRALRNDKNYYPHYSPLLGGGQWLQMTGA